ncbi:hypothetical protein [Methanolacinia paynteri]|uniref:hypothetical protein n=1 Tax=Methanolacinia paynteri TaxID=230356 RepID=UPI00064E3547|nr:hypothetical protein [Methanolacinia paynteri]
MKWLVAAGLIMVISCGCVAFTDEAVGTWENKSLPLQEIMTIKSDGTYYMSDMNGNGLSGGTWVNIEDHYIFTPESGGEKMYAGIARGGRGQVFMIFDNITYLKI